MRSAPSGSAKGGSTKPRRPIRKAVQANPRFSTLYVLHTSALALAGREEEARSVASRLLALEPNFRLQPFIAVFSTFFDKGLGELLLAGLRKAGLPE
jgi:hypothetical protein